jgi:hypothetical protein
MPDGRGGTRSVPVTGPGQTEEGRRETLVFRAIADVLRQIGGAIATVVTLPFRALARLLGGA